jgi:hypothetical protein
VLLLALLACPAPNPCVAYAEAYEKCLTDAGIDAPVDPATMCEDYEVGDPHADAYQECLADAYDRDCAASGALDAANEAAAECLP